MASNEILNIFADITHAITFSFPTLLFCVAFILQIHYTVSVFLRSFWLSSA